MSRSRDIAPRDPRDHRDLALRDHRDLAPRDHRRCTSHRRLAGRLAAVAGLAAVVLTWAGCTETLLGPKTDKAVAVIHPTLGNAVAGTVTFTNESGRVRVEAIVTGLSPGDHGFHIHEFGDCSGGDGKTAGGHFNPTGSNHGGPESAERHVGDLGNITANASGNATMNRLDDVITLQGDHSILGRGVIVHAGADDFTTQPTGAAGARVGCGVIGVHNASG